MTEKTAFFHSRKVVTKVYTLYLSSLDLERVLTVLKRPFFKISAKIQILPFWSFCHFLIEGCFIQSKLLVFPLSLHVKLHTHKNAPFPACNVFCRTHLGPCNFHSTISHLGYQYFSHFFPGFLILKPVCFFTWLQPRFRKFNTTSIMYWLTYTRFRGAIIFF